MIGCGKQEADPVLQQRAPGVLGISWAIVIWQTYCLHPRTCPSYWKSMMTNQRCFESCGISTWPPDGKIHSFCAMSRFGNFLSG
jgi:hypothetical protein